MFDSKEDLYDFLLTSDFDEKYSDLEYKYFLLGFKSLLRKMHSENSGLKNKIFELERDLLVLEEQKNELININNLNINRIKQLNKSLDKCKPWYKKIFKNK